MKARLINIYSLKVSVEHTPHSPFYYWLLLGQWEVVCSAIGKECLYGRCSSIGLFVCGRSSVPCFCSGCSSIGLFVCGRSSVQCFWCCHGWYMAVTSGSCRSVVLRLAVVSLFCFCVRWPGLLSEFSRFTVFSVIITNGVIISNNRISFCQSLRSTDTFLFFSYFVCFDFSTRT